MSFVNYSRTFILLAGMTAIFMAVGFLLGGEVGMILAFAVAATMNLVAYWTSDTAVLRMYGARRVTGQSAPEFYSIVQTLATRAELPMPKVYIIDTDQPNAFATGRNPDHAAVAATQGLLQRLNAAEVAGVMAHELAHIKNRDTLTMTITATLAGAIGMLANFMLFFGAFGNNRDNPMGGIGTIAVALLAPIAAMLVQMAISRAREYQADRLGAAISGDPLALASALTRIEDIAGGIDYNRAERNPATAHMFIINPLHGRGHDRLFSTHPNTANRVARLKAMAGQYASPAPRRTQASMGARRSAVSRAGQTRRKTSPWGRRS